MKEVPIPYVRTNQAAIVLFTVSALLLQLPLLIAIIWILQVIGLLSGGRGNVFILAVKPLFGEKVRKFKTEAFELQRFNNTIAVMMLTISVLFIYVFGIPIVGYIAAGIVSAAALAAVCGYCIGCTIYYQYKQFKARRRRAF